MHSKTIAMQLEHDRLQRRTRRMELASSALRDRAVYRHAISGITPTPLRQAIKTFELEVADMHRRLAELADLESVASSRALAAVREH